MANNSFTKNYADGTALTEAKLDTAYQSLKLDIGNTTQMTQGATAGHYLKCVTPGAAAEFAAPFDPRGFDTIRNIGIKCTVATGALVFTLTTGAGATPSTSDYATIGFSSNGATQATLQSVNVTTTKTFTLTASATLGTQSTSASFIYLYALKGSGTASSAVLLGVSRKGDHEHGDVVNTTAVSSSADSQDTLYATASTTLMPRLLGWAYTARNSTGSWQTPTQVNLASNRGRLSPSADWQSRNSITSTGTTVKQGGVALSNSCGVFNTTSATFVDVTNLSVTITTSGRPVMVNIVPDGDSSNEAYFEAATLNALSTSIEAEAKLLRGTTTIGLTKVQVQAQDTTSDDMAISVPSGSILAIDPVVAGTHTYKLQIRQNSVTTTARVYYSKLLAYEL